LSGKIAVHILPDDIHLTVEKNTSALKGLRDLGLDIWYPCGGNGSCGKCKVQFLKSAPPPTSAEKITLNKEELKQGFRLACRTFFNTHSTLRIPEDSRLRAITSLTSSLNRSLLLQPLLKTEPLELEPAKLNRYANRSAWLKAAVNKKNYTLLPNLVIKIPHPLPVEPFKIIAVILETEIIDLLPVESKAPLYGLAVDIGTTTLALSLIDLVSGETIGVESALNPQAEFGDDLISRVAAIMRSEALLREMRNKVIRVLNGKIRNLLHLKHLNKNQVYQAVVAGNTVMNHIFSGVHPGSVAYAPFAPVYKIREPLPASETGLTMAESGKVYVLPNIGGFVGGDVVADLLVSGFGKQRDEKRLLIDIGTNCELVLKYEQQYLAVSSPAGPALEGAKISQGMRAETGAISDAEIKQGRLVYTTIGHKPARGICGSGLFRIIELLLEIGVITEEGRIVSAGEIPDKNWRVYFTPRIKSNKHGVNKILLLSSKEKAAKGIYLVQQDVREFQLAKAAISSAWKMLLKEVSGRWQALDEVHVAGAFGNFIRPQTLQRLGVLPPVAAKKIRFIGNAALEGARMVLFNRENLGRCSRLIGQVRFLELAGKPDFQDVFVSELRLGNREVSAQNSKNGKVKPDLQ